MVGHISGREIDCPWQLPVQSAACLDLCPSRTPFDSKGRSRKRGNPPRQIMRSRGLIRGATEVYLGCHDAELAGIAIFMSRDSQDLG
jgi:hypothetical protein